MNDQISPAGLAIKFLNIESLSIYGRVTVSTLCQDTIKILWSEDNTGDLFLAGLMLIDEVGPVKNKKSIENFFRIFENIWLYIDTNIARIILAKFDECSSDADYKFLGNELELLIDWLSEDRDAISVGDYPSTWSELIHRAALWRIRDTELLEQKNETWVSLIDEETFTKFRLTPIDSSEKLLLAGREISEKLLDIRLLHSATRNHIRLFSISDDLKSDGAFAVLIIQNKKNGWTPLGLVTRAGIPKSQHLYRQLFLIAKRYTSREQIAAYRAGIQTGTDLSALENILMAILDETPELTNSCSRKDKNKTSSSDEIKISYMEKIAKELSGSSLYVDTNVLLDIAKLAALDKLVQHIADNKYLGTQIVIHGSVIDELERLRRQVNKNLEIQAKKALRAIEGWTELGVCILQDVGPVPTQHRYADTELINAVGARIAEGRRCCLLTSDLALRIRTRGTIHSANIRVTSPSAMFDSR